MESKSERAAVDVDGQAMHAYLARPEQAGSYPGVLLCMEVFGVNAHVRSVADRVAAEGYVVLAPDLFHRTGPGVELGYDEEGLAKGIELMTQVRADELIADLAAAHGALRARPDTTERIGAMGFCFGGHAAYLAAATLPVAATASFYGGGIAGPAPGGTGPSTLDRTPSIQGRILCLFGENDDYIPADQVAAIRARLEESSIDHDVVVYPGVGHGFFCDARPDYDEAAATDAWSRVTGLFASELAD